MLFESACSKTTQACFGTQLPLGPFGGVAYPIFTTHWRWPKLAAWSSVVVAAVLAALVAA